MADAVEKRKRKALSTQVKQAAQDRREANLPLPKSDLKALFDYLDAQLDVDDCDHSLRHTRAFLAKHQLPAAAVVSWLMEYGGYCDCEVLANVEEAWGEQIGSLPMQ